MKLDCPDECFSEKDSWPTFQTHYELVGTFDVEGLTRVASGPCEGLFISIKGENMLQIPFSVEWRGKLNFTPMSK